MPARRPVEALFEPEPSKACEEIKKSVLYRRSLVVVGMFSVRQDGKLYLTKGERLLMIKSDWSVIVHRDSFSCAPVLAWENCDSVKVMCGDSLSVVVEKEELQEERGSASEGVSDEIISHMRSLELEFDKVYAVISMNLQDGTVLLEPGDGELLTAVLLKPELIEAGFKPFPSTNDLKSGFVDLIGQDSRGVKTVIMLTKKQATVKNVTELSSFMASVRRHVSPGEPLRGILAAPAIAKAALQKLSEYGFEYKRIDLADVSEVLAFYRQENGERV